MVADLRSEDCPNNRANERHLPAFEVELVAETGTRTGALAAAAGRFAFAGARASAGWTLSNNTAATDRPTHNRLMNNSV